MMTDYQKTLLELTANLNTLLEREARYAGNAPPELRNQISDHRQAIALTEQARAGALTGAEWREQLRPLLVTIKQRGEEHPDYRVTIGDIHIHALAPVSASPPRRGLYVIAGALAGIAVNVAGNLLSAAIQQKYFANQFSDRAMWGLAAFAVIGALAGLWLSGLVPIPASAAPPRAKPIPTGDPNRVMITRLRAFLSYSKLRGKGIAMTDILLIGSKLDIDTRE